MRPLTLLLIVPILACAEQAAQPARPASAPAAAPAASAPRASQPAPMPSDRAFGTPLGQRAIEPAHDPFNTGAMEQYPAMPQQTSPAFQGL